MSSLVVEIGEMSAGSSAAMGLGVLVFFVWSWMSMKGSKSRGEVMAAAGIVVAAAFGGGWIGAAVVGEAGLSSLGAMAGGGVALWGTPAMGSLSWRERADILMAPGLAGLSVSRLGCLFAGCDFGRPTGGDWGVVYGRGTRAWDVHIVEYGMHPLHGPMEPVYPFALYLAVWGIVVAFVAQRLRRGDRPAGQAACFAAAIFLAGGGIVEWTREPATVVEVVEGVSAYPMIYLGAALVAVVVGLRFGEGGESAAATGAVRGNED